MTGRAEEILKEISDVDKKILELGDCDIKKQILLVMMFGNESERLGVKLMLFPLWSKEVIDQLKLVNV